MIFVIDYGMGNLRSVSKALEHLGGKVKVTSSPKDVAKAAKIVLPGVGAFGDAAKELRMLGLFDVLVEHIQRKKLFLGICLGLQLLFEASAESPGIKGLGVCRGKVRSFQSPGIKIPHMGWNSMSVKKRHPLLAGVRNQSYFYFVHTFYAAPKDKTLIIGSTRYGKESFPATIGTDSFFATQFHPEKSQTAGLTILKNFIKW